ncbi:MAG: hypothetical protein JXA10_17700 [Anaerolineae bacterium]|nr:hypothetical protein [Anaerolineae bacterium]
MDDAQREALIERLKGMVVRHGTFEVRHGARELRDIDKDAVMKFWRNSLQGSYQTVFELPNAGVKVILVEKMTSADTDHVVGGGPTGWTAKKSEYELVDVRIEDFVPVKR